MRGRVLLFARKQKSTPVIIIMHKIWITGGEKGLRNTPDDPDDNHGQTDGKTGEKRKPPALMVKYKAPFAAAIISSLKTYLDAD